MIEVHNLFYKIVTVAKFRCLAGRAPSVGGLIGEMLRNAEGLDTDFSFRRKTSD